MPTKKTTTTKKTPAKKTTVKADTQTTAIAVVKEEQVTQFTNLFGSLDVGALKAAIEDIANRQGKINNKEKKLALSIVDQWESGVIQQLRNEKNRATSFADLVKNFTNTYRSLIENPEYFEPMQQLIAIAGLEDEVAALKVAMDAAQFAHDEYDSVKSGGSDTNETMTDLEKLDKQCEFEKEVLHAKNEYDKATRNLKRQLSAFSLKLNSNENVKTCLNKLASYSRALSRSETDCSTKANAAKLAISIDDKDLRDKLNALITISVK